MEKNLIQAIVRRLEDDLLHLKNKKQDILIFSESAAGSCWVVLTEIRKIIIKNGFQNQEEEIDFFKNIKPKILVCTLITHISFGFLWFILTF